MEAILHTSEGNIRLELYPQSTPITIKNFVELVSGQHQWTHPLTGEVSTDPLYNEAVFHRVIDGFMIQGDDPLSTGTGGPGYVFDDEIDPNLAFTGSYLLAMANAGTRGGQGTNGSQFFITVAPTTWLNGKYTIFGRVTDDASRVVVDKITTTATDRTDRPLEDVMIETIEIVE